MRSRFDEQLALLNKELILTDPTRFSLSQHSKQALHCDFSF